MNQATKTKEYQCYLLDPECKLYHIGKVLLETDDLAEACSFVYKHFEGSNQECCVWQERTKSYREVHMPKRNTKGQFVK